MQTKSKWPLKDKLQFFFKNKSKRLDCTKYKGTYWNLKVFVAFFNNSVINFRFYCLYECTLNLDLNDIFCFNELQEGFKCNNIS